MKYVRQFMIIMAVTCAGEFIKFLLPVPVPASIYGLCVMLILLISGVLKVEQVEEASNFLIEIMPLMFIPASVGLLEAWGALSGMLLPVIVITCVSTVAVIAISGKTTEFMLKRKKK